VVDFGFILGRRKIPYEPVKTIVKFCLIVGVCVGGINFLERHFDDHKMAYSGRRHIQQKRQSSQRSHY
jgi:hypothetical protein